MLPLSGGGCSGGSLLGEGCSHPGGGNEGCWASHMWLARRLGVARCTGTHASFERWVEPAVCGCGSPAAHGGSFLATLTSVATSCG